MYLMGDKQFHQMLGKLFDTRGENVTSRIRGAKNKEEELRNYAMEKNITDLDPQDIKDLLDCLDEIHTIKSKNEFRSPRS
jgi:capsule polysaccharide export protein KpsC/LpsZ